MLAMSRDVTATSRDIADAYFLIVSDVARCVCDIARYRRRTFTHRSRCRAMRLRNRAISPTHFCKSLAMSRDVLATSRDIADTPKPIASDVARYGFGDPAMPPGAGDVARPGFGDSAMSLDDMTTSPAMSRDMDVVVQRCRQATSPHRWRYRQPAFYTSRDVARLPRMSPAMSPGLSPRVARHRAISPQAQTSACRHRFAMCALRPPKDKSSIRR